MNDTNENKNVLADRFIELRNSTDMNRKEFALTLQEEKQKDSNGLGNPLRGIEDLIEQNDNQLDGIINNLPNDETELSSVRESVIKKLKDCVKILEEVKNKSQKNHCPNREIC